MVYFKCRLSGNVVGFEYEWDVNEMRNHPQYDEVKELPSAVQTKVKKTTQKEVKETE